MKIPERNLSKKKWERIYNNWYMAAENLSLETGVFIAVRAEYEYEGIESHQKVSRIYFDVDNHEFDSLHDVKKAIENKAFL